MSLKGATANENESPRTNESETDVFFHTIYCLFMYCTEGAGSGGGSLGRSGRMARMKEHLNSQIGAAAAVAKQSKATEDETNRNSQTTSADDLVTAANTAQNATTPAPTDTPTKPTTTTEATTATTTAPTTTPDSDSSPSSNCK